MTRRERGAEDNPGPQKGLPKGLGELNVVISMDPYPACAQNETQNFTTTLCFFHLFIIKNLTPTVIAKQTINL